MSEVITLERKCKLEEVFEVNFLELLQLVPRNPLVRALVLKLTGKLPPLECETFEQLKDWIETHCEKRPKPIVHSPHRHNREDGIAINVDFSETEYGRAHYSVRRSGSDEFRIGADVLMEIIQEAIEDGRGIDSIVDEIAGKIDDDAWSECDPSLDDYGDYDYDEHDVNDSGDSATEYSRNDIRNAVLGFVRERHPELAAEL